MCAMAVATLAAAWRAFVNVPGGDGRGGMGPEEIDWVREASVNLLLSLALLLPPYYVLKGVVMRRRVREEVREEADGVPAEKRREKTERSLAWILTLICAVVECVVSLPHVWMLYRDGWTRELAFSTDPVSRFLLSFFAIYLIVDCWGMAHEYPTQADAVTGVTHHVFYTTSALYLLWRNCSRSFAVLLSIEWSTLPLSLGHVSPAYRNDLLFGTTFFLMRVVYHIWTVHQVWTKVGNDPYPVTILATVPLPMHLWWMWSWARGYTRRLRKQNKEMEIDNEKEKIG